MNKIKLGVGLILIVLCVAVLGIGLYAAGAFTNTATGRITVNGARPEVKISAYQGSYNPASPSTNRLGTPIEKRNGSGTISLGTLIMNDDCKYKSTYAESVIQIIVVIENHSFNQELGVYFWKDANNGGDGTIDKNTNSSDPEYGCVLYSDILYGHRTYNSTYSSGYYITDNVLDIEYEFYKHVPCATDSNSNGVFNSGTDTPGREVIRMYLRMNVLPESPAMFNFNVNLNIENYVPNYTTTSANQKVFTKVGSSNLINHPSLSNTKMCPTTWNSSVRYIVLPSQIDFIGWTTDDWSPFSSDLLAISFPTNSSSGNCVCIGCAGLTSVFLPYGCTTVGQSAFSGCSSLETIFFDTSVTTLNYAAFYNCSSLKYLSIHSGTWSWGDLIFYNCIDIKAVYIYASQLRTTNISGPEYAYFYSCEDFDLHIPTSRASNHASYYGGTYWRYYGSSSYYTPIADL